MAQFRSELEEKVDMLRPVWNRIEYITRDSNNADYMYFKGKNDSFCVAFKGKCRFYRNEDRINVGYKADESSTFVFSQFKISDLQSYIFHCYNFETNQLFIYEYTNPEYLKSHTN